MGLDIQSHGIQEAKKGADLVVSYDVVKYLEAQIKEAERRPESEWMRGYMHGLRLAVVVIKTGWVGIFSAGSDEMWYNEEE